MTFELRTRRLTLRPVRSADTLELHELWTSAGVRRYLWDDEIISLGKTRDAIVKSERLFRDRGLGLWGARDAQTNGLMAFAGFWHFHDPPALELLYGVKEDLWGQGYAVEAARAVIEYGANTLEMERIQASTDEANAASVRVLQKLGFELTARRIIKGRETTFYCLQL